MATSQLSTLKTQNVNWKACVFWGLVLAGVVLAVNYYREPILTFIAHPTFDLSWLQNLTFDKIVAFLKDYGFLITGGVAVFTFAYGFYQRSQANKAALELLRAKSEMNDVYGTADQYRRQAESYKFQYEQAAKADLQGALSESQLLVQDQQSKFTLERADLQGQIRSLQDMLLLKDTKVVEKVVVK